MPLRVLTQPLYPHTSLLIPYIDLTLTPVLTSIAHPHCQSCALTGPARTFAPGLCALSLHLVRYHNLSHCLYYPSSRSVHPHRVRTSPPLLMCSHCPSRALVSILIRTSHGIVIPWVPTPSFVRHFHPSCTSSLPVHCPHPVNALSARAG
jgi:hypothetical protein